MYEGDIRPLVEEGNEGKFVAIDIETGAYEVDADELAASDRLLARIPDAQVWLKRIGSRYVRHFGPRPQPGARWSRASLESSRPVRVSSNALNPPLNA